MFSDRDHDYARPNQAWRLTWGTVKLLSLTTKTLYNFSFF